MRVSTFSVIQPARNESAYGNRAGLPSLRHYGAFYLRNYAVKRAKYISGARRTGYRVEIFVVTA